MSQPEPAFDTVVVRFGGEIGIKAAWTRKLYEKRLISNIKAVLKHHDIPYASFVRRFGRLYIKTNQPEEVAEKLSRVFGVSSLSPALETTSNLDDIQKISVRLAGSMFKNEKSFAVRCNRVGKHAYTSQDVCRQVGQSIQTRLHGLNLRVDLTHPEQTLHVEVREDKAYVFTVITKGVSGLPLGTQPKLVCLLQSDASSAVACWMTMKRGCPPLLLHFKDSMSDKKRNVEYVKDLAQKLMNWAIGFPRKLWLVEYGQNFQGLAQKHPAGLRNLERKRLMLRMAEHIAEKERAEGIVVGDSLGEKVNQTLHAFRMQDDAVKNYPIYRPLVGLDVHDIKEIAKRIGLEKTALKESKSREDIKGAQVAAIKLEDIKRFEKKLNIEQVVEDALKSLTVLRV